MESQMGQPEMDLFAKIYVDSNQEVASSKTCPSYSSVVVDALKGGVAGAAATSVLPVSIGAGFVGGVLFRGTSSLIDKLQCEASRL